MATRNQIEDRASVRTATSCLNLQRIAFVGRASANNFNTIPGAPRYAVFTKNIEDCLNQINRFWGDAQRLAS